MKPVDLETGAARIRHALESLELAWHDAGEQWDDGVSRAFARENLEPLVPVVKLTLDAVARMDRVLREAQRDCEA